MAETYGNTGGTRGPNPVEKAATARIARYRQPGPYKGRYQTEGRSNYSTGRKFGPGPMAGGSIQGRVS